jgi:hypothetical protein
VPQAVSLSRPEGNGGSSTAFGCETWACAYPESGISQLPSSGSSETLDGVMTSRFSIQDTVPGYGGFNADKA